LKKVRDFRSRRDFFRLGKPPEPAPDLYLLNLGRRAMGSRVEIVFPAEYRSLVEEVQRAMDEVRRLEGLMSYFDPGSRISQINRDGAECPVPVEPELFLLLNRCRELWEWTGGAFDAAAGALWRCWGFHRREGRLPPAEDLADARLRSGFHLVELDDVNRQVSLDRPGVELNLGSIGKGFALDRAGAMLQNAGFERVLLNAGSSSVLAIGRPSQDVAGWRVSVRHPVRLESNLLTLRLENLGMGTSGIEEQYFELDGRRYGHIIDPRSGESVLNHLSTTAIAPDAATADGLATAFFVMQMDEIERFCQSHSDVGAIVARSAGEGGRVEILSFGCATDCIEKVNLD
jgi:thiamine biosynthesis lipoprotein